MASASTTTLPTMWVPNTTEQIEAAAVAGDLPETSSFDAKRELPAHPRKNADLAIDVAAMATDGGVLLYGVAEDEHGRPTIPTPIALVGAAERIGQIVSTCIAEVPYIDIRDYPLAEDPARGYILVIVPQSARAPHQVTVGGDLRFYGRGAKGNRMLTEGEVARLYERRHSWAVDRERLLADVIANAPIPPHAGLGYLHGFTRPAAPDPALFERAADATSDLHMSLLSAVRSTALHGRYAPSLGDASFFGRRSADEWWLSNTGDQHSDLSDPKVISDAVILQLGLDGRGELFCGRATDTRVRSPDDNRYLFEVVIAGSLDALFAAMAMIYEAAAYHGQVDVGVAVTGIKGAFSFVRSQDLRRGDFAYPRDDFKRTATIAAAELEDHASVAHRLLRPLYETTSGIDGYNPSAQPQTR